MLNTKLNLYNAEWLDVVFTDRNKSYGAYNLRQHYGSNMVKAMAIGLTAIISAALIYSYVTGQKDSTITTTTVVVIPPIQPPLVKIKEKIEPPAAKPAASKPLPAAPATAFTVPKITNDPVDVDPPKITDLPGDISNITSTGKGTISQVVDPGPGAEGTGVDNVPDETIRNPSTIEVMPQPVGGVEAWSKFLSKNLRFPAEAQEAGIGGRVIVSFVVEKDGHLSNIKLERGAGYGMDEEALRVLKLAKPWKPGIQNGMPVRVQYTIPLNFQLSE